MSLAEAKMQAVEKKIAKLAPGVARATPDVTALELIRDHTGNLRLLTWDGHRAGIVDEFARGDVVHTPLEIHPSICDSLVLPSGLAAFGTTRQLFDQVAGLITSASGGSKSVAVPLTFLVFASWFPDFAPVAPFVWVVTPATCDTAALMQMLRLLCWRALVVSRISNNWLSSLPRALQPTLIADVDRPTRPLLSALRASQTHGLCPARAGQAFDPFCAKLIFAREALEDPAAAGYPLEIFLNTNGPYVPPIDSAQAARVAGEFQNKFLRYRLKNHSKITPPSFDLGKFSAPVQALAHSFAGPIVDDNDLQAQILPYLRELNSEIQTDSDSTLNAMILEVLLSRWNETDIGVTEISCDLNTIIMGRGGREELSPEKVGHRLRGLGLRTIHNSPGFKVLRMVDARPAIQKLAAAYGLSVPEPFPVAPQHVAPRRPKDRPKR